MKVKIDPRDFNINVIEVLSKLSENWLAIKKELSRTKAFWEGNDRWHAMYGLDFHYDDGKVFAYRVYANSIGLEGTDTQTEVEIVKEN